MYFIETVWLCKRVRFLQLSGHPKSSEEQKSPKISKFCWDPNLIPMIYSMLFYSSFLLLMDTNKVCYDNFLIYMKINISVNQVSWVSMFLFYFWLTNELIIRSLCIEKINIFVEMLLLMMLCKCSYHKGQWCSDSLFGKCQNFHVFSFFFLLGALMQEWETLIKCWDWSQQVFLQ